MKKKHHHSIAGEGAGGGELGIELPFDGRGPAYEATEEDLAEEFKLEDERQRRGNGQGSDNRSDDARRRGGAMATAGGGGGPKGGTRSGDLEMEVGGASPAGHAFAVAGRQPPPPPAVDRHPADVAGDPGNKNFMLHNYCIDGCIGTLFTEHIG